MGAEAGEAAVNVHPLDAATSLTWRDGQWIGRTNRNYWAFVGQYGGATAAVLLRAALDHPDRIGDPLALTVNYCAPIAEGEFRIRARAARTNRSTQHWIIELFQAEGDVLATATAVFARRRPGWTHELISMPKAPPPTQVEAVETFVFPGPSWLQQYEMRFVTGRPVLGKVPHAEFQPAETMVWMRDAVPRPLDALSLVSMSDAFIGRVFQVLGVLVPFGTVSLTTYFHGGAADLTAEGGWILGHADAAIFRDGFGDQTARLWSPDGRLLASSVQATYFRDWAPEGK
jgi:acyl-CoA thioesterase